jgi:CheY-like chemotaxis protein/HPt (histidine-containing phosphotransfer) domain-containing protein
MHDSQMGSRHPLRILLAEDDATSVLILSTILERLGYRADVAESGAEALAALQTRDYDVILMSLEMTHINGLEVAREIRRLAVEQRPRIIGMAVEKEDFRKYLDGGIDDCIRRPVQIEELAEALARTLPKGTAMEHFFTSSQPAAASEPPPLDATALKRLKNTLGSQAEAMFPVLLEDFFRDGARLLAAAGTALEKNDPEELRRSAHTLKSNGATFGAMRLSAAAKELEFLARQRTIDGAAALIERTAEEFERAKGLLERYRKGA